ncbi:MAG: MATE family efflux transporter [Wujia sp.]
MRAEKTKNVSSVKDLTEGSPMKLIIGFALPMFLGLLFQQFYSMVDTVIVGKYLGVDPFAGVGSTGSLNFIVIGFCSGLCNGFAVLVAQKFGAKDQRGLRKMVANSIWLCIVFGIVITTLMIVFCKPLLRLMNTPDDIFRYAYVYIVIIFAGIPCTILYNITAAIIRALGDSKSPIIFLAVSSIVNIVLDYVFIVMIGMNVEGAALATVISQGVSGMICVVFMKKRFSILKMEQGDMRPEPSYMVNLSGVGIPMGLQYSITGIGSVVLQTAVNGLGSMYVAGMAAGTKLSTLLMCPLDALGQTMAPYAGQNVGAGKIDRVERGLKAASLCGFVVSVVMMGVVLLFGNHLAMLFLDEENSQVLSLTNRYLIINVAFYFLLTLVNTVRFTIQGMGYSAFAVFAGVFEMAARSLAGAILVPVFGFMGACVASPLAWFFADAFLIPAFLHCRNRLQRIVHAQA